MIPSSGCQARSRKGEGCGKAVGVPTPTEAPSERLVAGCFDFLSATNESAILLRRADAIGGMRPIRVTAQEATASAAPGKCRYSDEAR